MIDMHRVIWISGQQITLQSARSIKDESIQAATPSRDGCIELLPFILPGNVTAHSQGLYALQCNLLKNLICPGGFVTISNNNVVTLFSQGKGCGGPHSARTTGY